METIIAFLVEFLSTDHLVVSSNVALAVVTYRLIPAKDRHVIRASVRKAARIKAKVRHVEPDIDYDDFGFPG